LPDTRKVIKEETAMSKRGLYVLIVLLAVLAFAGWTRAWSFSQVTEAASPATELDHSGFVLDYQEDAELFAEGYEMIPAINAVERIPDYPKDGELYAMFYITE
jgi:hypothetical protein